VYADVSGKGGVEGDFAAVVDPTSGLKFSAYKVLKNGHKFGAYSAATQAAKGLNVRPS
jgi:hypothetical protein